MEADLIAAGMPVEMADRDTIVPIVTLADDEHTVARFTETLVAAMRAAPRPAAAAPARGGLAGHAGAGHPAPRGFFRAERNGR